MELEVGWHSIGVDPDRSHEGLQRRLHREEVLWRSPLRRKAGRFGFQADAQFKHCNHIGDGGKVLRGDPEVAGIGWWQHESADAVTGLDQSARLQTG